MLMLFNVIVKLTMQQNYHNAGYEYFCCRVAIFISRMNHFIVEIRLSGKVNLNSSGVVFFSSILNKSVWLSTIVSTCKIIFCYEVHNKFDFFFSNCHYKFDMVKEFSV